MLNLIIENNNIVTFLGIFAVFFLTVGMTMVLKDKLPKDGGREFAHDGKLSAGKPRGAGILFIISFGMAFLIFGNINMENAIFVVLTILAMLTGFLDDAAKTPWGEYKKGILDLLIASGISFTFLHFNESQIYLASVHKYIDIPQPVFFVLAVILVWASINVTNCTDGVDGLSGTLTITTLSGLYIISNIQNHNSDFNNLILYFIVAIVAYLWFNATPSILMMGDAGSRAMGLFIAIVVLKTGSPIIYLLTAGVMIVDGGLGLIKVALLRFLKIRILKNTRTPLHDHVRKVWGWSNTQTVFRFVIIQVMLVVISVYLFKF